MVASTRRLLALKERVYLAWDPDVVAAARAADVAIDPNGHLAPASMLDS